MAAVAVSPVQASTARFFVAGRERSLLHLEITVRTIPTDHTLLGRPVVVVTDGYQGRADFSVQLNSETKPRLEEFVGKAAWLWLASLGLMRVIIFGQSFDMTFTPTNWEEGRLQFGRVAVDWVSSGLPIAVPERLLHHLPQIVRFEDEQALEPYHDWCLDSLWTERAEQLAKMLDYKYEMAGDHRPRH